MLFYLNLRVLDLRTGNLRAIAPKARDLIAQGNALGWQKTTPSPEGAKPYDRPRLLQRA